MVKPNCKYKIHGFTNLKIDETSIASEESNSLDLCNSKFLSIFYRSLKNWKQPLNSNLITYFLVL